MAGQLHAVLGVVASHMGNNGQLALCHLHDIFQHNLLILNALVDALPGGAVYIHALDALINEILCQLLHPLRADFTSLIVAGIKCRNNTLILVQISHDCFPLFCNLSCFQYLGKPSGNNLRTSDNRAYHGAISSQLNHPF